MPIAISLLVVSLLWMFLCLFGIAFFVAEMLDPETSEDTKRIYTTYIMYESVSIAYALLLCTGAFSMLRRGSYVWAVVISCLGCVPLLGPCYVLAIPIGIWSLKVLRDKDVRASFRNDTLLQTTPAS